MTISRLQKNIINVFAAFAFFSDWCSFICCLKAGVGYIRQNNLQFHHFLHCTQAVNTYRSLYGKASLFGLNGLMVIFLYNPHRQIFQHEILKFSYQTV